MIKLLENTSLKPYNSLSIEVNARYLANIHSEQDLPQALAWAEQQNLPARIIGTGSNIVLTQEQQALVLIMQTKGINILEQQGSCCLVEVAAGEVWQDLVNWAIARGLGGIENLSLIPSSVGAAPVQNIGAYGVELKDVCHSVVAFNCHTKQLDTLNREQCLFSYRDSIFKQQPNKWVVLKVRLILDSQAPINIAYAALQQKIATNHSALNYAQVSQLVCETRLDKLPDPKVLGNVGSFFKNPIVPIAQAEALKQCYVDLVSYPYNNTSVKLAAGWLIDKAGLKGYREGDVGTYPKQALVLVNYGNASGQQIVAFSKKIQKQVKRQFAVELEPEPIFY